MLYALFRLGGAEHMVDLEHVAVEAHRMAPELFQWRHYNFPSVETCRMAFRHANEHVSEPRWLSGGAGRERMLTAAGIRRVREFMKQRSVLDPPNDVSSRPISRDLLRMEKHPAFQRWRTTGANALTIYDIADLLNCQPGAGRSVIEDRIRMAGAAAERWKRTDLLRFLTEVTSSLDSIMEVNRRDRDH